MISNIMKGNTHPVAALSKHLRGGGMFSPRDFPPGEHLLLNVIAFTAGPQPGAGFSGQEGGPADF